MRSVHDETGGRDDYLLGLKHRSASISDVNSHLCFLLAGCKAVLQPCKDLRL